MNVSLFRRRLVLRDGMNLVAKEWRRRILKPGVLVSVCRGGE
ncbi:hypothetical protein [Yokenella regensburgei]